jgi:KDO2-lipid IV(A) lauroyltransferase
MRKNKIVRNIFYFRDGTFLLAFVAMSRILPFKFSSYLFGKIFRFALPFIKSFRKKIKQNLDYIYPQMDEAQKKILTYNIYESLGRLVGEFKIKFMSKKSVLNMVDIKGDIEEMINLSKQNKSFIIINAHLGNWEVGGNALHHLGIKLCVLYRISNNPISEAIFKYKRPYKIVDKDYIKDIMSAIKNGYAFSNMQDHRLDIGIKIPFLGKDALTSTFSPKLAIKNNMRIFYVQCIRKDNSKNGKMFELSSQEIKHNITSPTQENVEKLTRIANDLMSEKISQHKEQWLWLHRRWKNAK